MSKLNVYLSGERLYGDDFNLEQIKKWYDDEKEGYADLGAKEIQEYKYVYHSLNLLHGFKYLRNNKFSNVLGLGSAWGDEFIPIASQIQKLTILDPSDAFENRILHGIPTTYIKPNVDGRMPFADCSFDLITCLGVLHHIANVTAVVNEIFRCLSIGGVALIREPIVSMGDWSKSRHGLTAHERGIPMELFRSIIVNSGFTIFKESLCCFPIVPKLWNYFGRNAYLNNFGTKLDAKLSTLFKWNLHYHHSDRLVNKFAPTSVYFVLTKLK